MSVNLSVIDDIVSIIDVILESKEKIPNTLLEELLDNVYRLTYNIVLLNLKNITLLTPQKKAIFTKYIKAGTMLQYDEKQYSLIEYNLYKILYVLSVIDPDSYAVIYKIL